MHTIFLDLDDTLLDNRTAEDRAALEFAALFGREIPNLCLDTFTMRWREISEKHFAGYLAGSLSFQGQRRQRMREVFETDIADERCDELHAIYLRYYEEYWTLFDDVLPFLNRCRDKLGGIITDGGDAQQRQKLERLGIAGYFTHLFTRESIGFSKHNPDAFRVVLERLGMEPQRMVYIGDSPTCDVAVPASVGIRAVWLNRRGKEGPPGIPVVNSLDEVDDRVLRGLREAM